MSVNMSGTPGAIDFEGLARSLLARARGLLEQWFPNGKWHGREYRVGSISGEPGESLSINVDTGAWADFNPAGGGLKGGDLISLYAAMRRIGQVDAAKELNGEPPRTGAPKPANVVPLKQPPEVKRTNGDWAPILPIPADAPAPPAEHYSLGAPAHIAHYRDREGRLLALIYRCDVGDGKKEFFPLTYCQHGSGRRAWRWQSLPKPRSLYGAEKLGQPGSVLVVEGEKTADAAQRLLGDRMIVIAWPGGGNAAPHADWSQLDGRNVIIWPDADKAGQIAAAHIAVQLRHVNAKARIVVLPKGVHAGWDLADAEAAGWNGDRVMAFVDGQGDVPTVRRRDDGPDGPGDGPGGHGADPQQRQQYRDFLPLGHDHGRFYFLTSGGGQVREFSARDLQNVGCLCELAPLQYWEMSYPAKEGFSTRAAGDALVQSCYRVGVYDPDRRRGRGAWLDDGRVVLHTGDHLIVDGVETALSDMVSHAIYERGRRMSLPIAAEPLSEADAEKFLDLCMSCSWDEPAWMGRLLAGWLVIAPVCGAMPWRPHIYITGEAGTGKSWIVDKIIRPMIGDIVLAVASKSTEAGLRGELQSDARPVMFDEFESQNESDRQRIQHVLDLARQASSEDNAPILKGTQTGGARRGEIRSCFAFSSINLGLQQAADESRTVVLSLFLDPDPEFRTRTFKHIQELHAQVVTPEVRAALRARTLKLLPAIRQNADVFAAAIARSGATRRTGDTIGVMLAGAWSLTSEKVATPAEADEFLEAREWLKKAVKRSETDPEWRRALDFLVQIPLRTAISNRATHQDIPVAELLESVVYYGDTATVSKDDAQTALHRAGLKVTTDEEGGKAIHKLVIAKNSEPLRRAFSGTPWTSSWETTLARTPGSAKLPQPTRFGSLRSRGITIPLSTALGGQDQ